MIALEGEVALVHRAFLLAEGLADSRRAGIHVEDQPFGRAALADSIYPSAEHRHQGTVVI